MVGTGTVISIASGTSVAIVIGTMTGIVAGAAGSVPAAAAPDPLLERAHSLLEALHSPLLIPFLREWPSPSRRRRLDASPLPALRWLPLVKQAAPAFSSPLVDALVEAAPSLRWRRSYTAATAGPDFYDSYGWTEFAGLSGPVPSKHIACGVLLLGPHVIYPPHRHEADEIYVPLVGTTRWQHGTAAWGEAPPGSVIHHAPHELHAMQTGPAPLLALYLWRSSNLAQCSHLDNRLSVT